jgi:hypothetical protein
MRMATRVLATAAIILTAWGVVAAPAGANPVARTDSGIQEATPSTVANLSATNLRYIYLEWPVTVGATACKVRNIYIARGWYRWLKYNAKHPAYRIYLASGNYRWTDCVRAVVYDIHGRKTYKTESSLTFLANEGVAHYPFAWHLQGPSRWLWFGSTLTKE